METKTMLFIGILLITSGCMENLDLNNSDNSNSEQMPNRGLEIQEFTITDNTLRPEQNAMITASLKNHHEEISLEEVEIFNEGPHLTVEKRGCTPSESDLEGAQQNIYPKMECNWEVEAPSESEIDGFRERTEPVKLRVSYEASVENREALKVSFQDIEDIENTQTVSRSFENGEVEASMTTESPVAASSGNSVELSASNSGDGRIDGVYEFSYTPDVFENCPESDEPIGNNDWSTVCDLSSESTGTRNLFFTVDYKYIKEPNLDITLVNRG